MRGHGLLVPQRRIPRGEHAGRIQTTRSDQVWATDLTKIPTREGWLQMVSVIDGHDRDLIGRPLRHQRRHRGVPRRAARRGLGALPRPARAFQDARAATQPRLGLAVHQPPLRRRAGDAGDPQPADDDRLPRAQRHQRERFIGALKDEEVWPTEYDTRAEAIAAIDA